MFSVDFIGKAEKMFLKPYLSVFAVYVEECFL